MVYARYLGFFGGPLLFLILELILTPSADLSQKAIHVIAMAAWLITWWISEAAPVAVTSLLPLVLFPALGVMSMTEAAVPYANPVIFLFMGGFMIALALEKHKLHERIALSLIRVTGTSGNGIILGFTLSTGIISMWISNTATALMMLPIAVSVIDLLKQQRSPGEQTTQHEKNFALGLMLAVGYSASIGGIATIIGTPPNVVFVGFMKEFYGQEMDFGKWMLVGVPVSMVTLFACYFIITRLLFPNRMAHLEGSEQLIRQKFEALGPIRKEEKLVLLVFSVTSFCWIFQQPLNAWFGKEALNDTNIAIAGGLTMFLVPVEFRSWKFLLDWESTSRLPWSILILFGGGICLAKAMETAGIIQWIGDAVAQQSALSSLTMIFVLTALSLILSEFMSNVALVTIFIPVVFGIADSLGINPILAGMPVAFAASCGFMFPIATPPNAIVFASGHIPMKEMVKAGLLLDIISVLIIILATATIIPWVYQ
jgi:sodium-dependent dicarboxylate transporter 2/3/5